MSKELMGWRTVYAFTCRQTMKKVSYIAVTILVGLLLFGGLLAIILISAAPDDEEGEEDDFAIKTVYVCNQTELEEIDFEAQTKESYPKLTYVTLAEQTLTEAVKKVEKPADSVIVMITKSEQTYKLSIALPADTDVDKSDADALGTSMLPALQNAVYAAGGLTLDQVAFLNMEAAVTNIEVGEDTSFLTLMAKYLLPALLGLILYMILLIYGQEISKSVSVEKTSKLMETLLTCVKPYALLFGKVLAGTTAALVQVLIWILCAIGGVIAGSIAVDQMYPEEPNVVGIALTYLKDNLGDTAMTPQAALLALLIFCLGVLCFFVLAGLAGSIVSKPEDTAYAQVLYVYPVLISFMVSYFGSLSENTKLIHVCRFIPFTAPFGLPVELLTGAAPLYVGFIACAELILTSMLLVYLAAKIYKGLMLYNGQKVSFKTIVGALKAK